MPKSNPAPPRQQWESLEYRGGRFHRFVVESRGDALIPFSIAERIGGRYEVGNVLARGGGGIVLTATDRRTGRRVLVKALLDYNFYRQDLREPLDELIEGLRRLRHHLQTERRILVQLHNAGSNAVPFPIDFAYDANPILKGPHYAATGQPWRFNDLALITSEPYLVMQHVRGTSLKTLLREQYRGGFEEPVALSIVEQAADVLGLLHRPLDMPGGLTWRLVYQDLKPSNLHIDEYGHVTVLDFGGCQLVIDDTIVLHGSHSPGYAPPECGNGDDPVTPAADVYSLGSTLFHLISGVNPRDMLPKNRPEGSHPAVRIDPSRLSQRCSAGVVELVARCVAWEPSHRPQSIEEFRALLKEVQGERQA